MRVNPWLIAVVVSIATFMEVLDTSIANVSLQHIAGSLSASQDESTWVLTSYLVSNAIVLPISGWLATVIGRKRFYMTVRGAVHVQFLAVRTGAVAELADYFPGDAGDRGRRAAAERAGDSCGYLYAEAARAGVCGLWNRGGGCAGDRADPGGMDHG